MCTSQGPYGQRQEEQPSVAAVPLLAQGMTLSSPLSKGLQAPATAVLGPRPEGHKRMGQHEAARKLA